MTPEALMSKAVRALESAGLLLGSGDIDGACNRAYFAMFDAAKAALIELVPGIDPALAKTQNWRGSPCGGWIATGLWPSR